MKRKIDPDIQIEVADEFCARIDAGQNLLELMGWSIKEMDRRQAERNARR